MLTVRPLLVEITFSNQPLSADRNYDIECQAFGSRPPARITWWINGHEYKERSKTVSSSRITALIRIVAKLLRELIKIAPEAQPGAAEMRDIDCFLSTPKIVAIDVGCVGLVHN